jgi:hypothetical protein
MKSYYIYLSLYLEEVSSLVMELQMVSHALYSPDFSSVSIWSFPEVKDSHRGLHYQYRPRTKFEGEIYERGEYTTLKIFPNLSIQTEEDAEN